MPKEPSSHLDALINDVVANISPLTGESVVNTPENPWLSNPRYKARLAEVHELLDCVKNGGKFIVIAGDLDDTGEDIKFFTANIQKPKVIETLSKAITKIANKLGKDEPPAHK